MPYYSLRLTPGKISDSHPKHYRLLFKELLKQYDIRSWALAWEKLNKYLEPCDPHYHFNFITDAQKETVRSYITRWNLFGNIKGKTCYALSSYIQPEDEQRWWRYCFKEECLGHRGLEDVVDLSNISLLATDERKRSAVWNVEKREKIDSKKSQFERYEKHVEQFAKKHNINQQIIFCKFLELVVSDKKSVNHKQLLSWSHLYMLKHNYLTPIQYYNLYPH